MLRCYGDACSFINIAYAALDEALSKKLPKELKVMKEEMEEEGAEIFELHTYAAHTRRMPPFTSLCLRKYNRENDQVYYEPVKEESLLELPAPQALMRAIAFQPPEPFYAEL